MADFGGILGAFVGGAGAGVADVGLREIQGRIDADKAATLEAARAANQMALAERESTLRKGEYAARTPVDVAKAEALLPIEQKKTEQEAEQKIRVAKESPRTLAAGASEIVGDKVMVTAPEKALPREQLDYYQANANRLNAEADAIRQGMKYQTKAGAVEKPMLPNIKVEKDAEGNPYMIDQNSGAIGIIRPGEPAKPGAMHWFSPDEPATKAGAPTTDWNLNGKPVQLEQLYPAISGRVGGAQQQPPVPGARMAPDGNWYVESKESPSGYARVDIAGKAKAEPATKVPATSIAARQAAAPKASAESSKQEAYQQALNELNDMRGGILPTPESMKPAIKAKQAEVDRLYRQLYQ